MKSLKALASALADSEKQIEILERDSERFTPFADNLQTMGSLPLRPGSIDTLQVNVGKLCNQTCKHCHVDAGPDRKEIMTRETMQLCLDVLKTNDTFTTVDITGGAPELNPHFRWFVTELKKLNKHIMVRCNLTIILANKKYHDLPEFYKEHQVEVISSLPFYTQNRTDRQRGDGVFDTSIKALQMLNAVGYGKEGSGLILDLVYNPAGAFLPPDQAALEKEYKAELQKTYNIEFNNLFAITNLPISRFLDYLIVSGNYEQYMDKLVNAFNPATVNGLMCRNSLSVGWDGYIYDCDFNQMLDLKVACSHSQHLSSFSMDELKNRNIVVNQHCYGCTAGAGSSCGGTVA